MATPDAGMPGASTGPSQPSPLPTGISAEATSTSTVTRLGSTSQGVVGINGLMLTASPQGSIVSSQKDNVHLEKGTQLLLKTQ